MGQDKDLDKMLRSAVVDHNIEVVKEIIGSEAGQVDLTYALVYAVDANDLAMVKLLIESGAKISNGALAVAMYEDSDIAILSELLECDVDLNQFIEENQKTPLMFAARNGDFERVRMLVEAGADVNVEHCGTSAIWYAAKGGWEEIYNYLSQLCKDPLVQKAKKTLEIGLRYRNLHGNSDRLFALAAGGQVKLIKDLLEKGVDVNARRASGGETALHIATEKGHTQTVLALLDAGADPTVKDSRGRTAYDIVQRLGFQEIEVALRMGSMTRGMTHGPES